VDVEDALALGAATLGKEEAVDAAAQVESGLGGVSVRVRHDLQDVLELPQGGGGLASKGNRCRWRQPGSEADPGCGR
jgi:hypothetical protein